MNEIALKKFEVQPEHKAAIYARKSLKNDNNSIESQIQEAQNILIERNFILHNIYIDDGVSGRHTKIEERKDLNRLLHDALNNKFKTVIVYKSDRLARNINQAIKIKRIFRKCGINVIYASQKDFPVAEGYTGDFVHNILMGIDQLEADTIARRIEMGKRNKRMRGEYSSGRSAPFGFIPKQLVNGTFYEADKDLAKMIEKFFLRCASDKEPPTNIKDFISFAKDAFNGYTEKNINLTFVKSLVTNPTYAALIIIDAKKSLEDILGTSNLDELILNGQKIRKCVNVEPIIEPHIFEKTFSLWNSLYTKRDYTNYTYVFQGLLKCIQHREIKASGGNYQCAPVKCKECSSRICNNVEKCETYINCKTCKTTTKGINLPKESLESIVLDKIIDKLTDEGYLKNNILKMINDKIESIKKSILEDKNQLDRNKFNQNLQLEKLVIDPFNETTRQELNELLEEESRLMNLINQKEAQIYSIKSNYKNPVRLNSIINHLANSNSLLDEQHIAKTKNDMSFLIEKVIVEPRIPDPVVKELDYGN